MDALTTLILAIPGTAVGIAYVRALQRARLGVLELHQCLAQRGGHQRHRRMVGDIHQVERRRVDEVLVTGDAPHVAGRHELQVVRSRLVAVQAFGQGDVDADLLRVHRARRRAPAEVVAVDPGGGPQQRRAEPKD